MWVSSSLKYFNRDYWWLPNAMYVSIFPYSTKRSEKQGGADSDKDSQKILDDDMEAIESVDYEPKERRRKGTKKKKGRRRWKVALRNLRVRNNWSSR